jgi:diguanylate cyclase (GGDEF)-like protein
MPDDRRPTFLDEPDDRTAEFNIADLAGSKGAAQPARRKVPALTAIAGRALGRVFRLEAPEIVVGRADDSGVCIQDEGVSRKHAKVTLVDGRHVLADLGSKNGTLVNDAIIKAPVVLQEGDSIRMGPHTILRYAQRDELDEQLQERLYDLATRDPLTQAYNRRAFEERLAAEWAWAKRHDKPAAICMANADHFKRVNDTYGHGAGDYVLSELANVVRGMIRKEDVFARIGGEEFVVLARATPMPAAMVFAERLRAAMERHAFVFEGHALRVTVSVGVAISSDPGVATAADLMARADAALYRAKNEGRNRVATVA